MRGGDYRLEVKIIQKFENQKKFQKKIHKISFSPGWCYQPGLKVELHVAAPFSPGSGLNRD